MQNNQRVGTVSIIMMVVGLIACFYGFIQAEYAKTVGGANALYCVAGAGIVLFLGGVVKIALFNANK